jgi:putative transposase
MGQLKIFVHFIWTTKEKIPFLYSKELRFKMWRHIFTNASQKNINTIFVSGYNNHCHCLVEMPGNLTVYKVIQLLKGESSHWINEQKLLKYHFDWDDDYLALSVSASKLSQVKQFIENQEKYHESVTFEQEMQGVDTIL